MTRAAEVLQFHVKAGTRTESVDRGWLQYEDATVANAAHQAARCLARNVRGADGSRTPVLQSDEEHGGVLATTGAAESQGRKDTVHARLLHEIADGLVHDFLGTLLRRTGR